MCVVIGNLTKMNPIYTVLISSFAAFIVAYVTARATSYSKGVIEERQKWRERIRCLAIDAAKLIRNEQTQHQDYEDLCSEFRLRLNPDCDYDRKILLTLSEGIKKPTDIVAKKLLAQVARLLKHDWERAKKEASMFPFILPNEPELRTLKSRDYLD